MEPAPAQTAPQPDRESRQALTSLDWIAVGIIALVATGLMATPWVSTPAFMAMFQDFGSTLPGITKLVAQTWFPLLGILGAGALVVTGVTGRRHLWLRRFLFVAAFFLAVGFMAFYILGMYAPIFELASAVSAD
jgi:hypothetical protein